jgi:hypothetical protein
MRIAKLRGPLGAVAIGAALATGSSAVADDGGRHYRPAPHHEFTDDQRPYRAAPHHPQPGEVTIPYGLVAEPPPAASSGGGIDWDDAVIGGGALAVLMATAGVLARRRLTPKTATRDGEARAEGVAVSGR